MFVIFFKKKKTVFTYYDDLYTSNNLKNVTNV